ncbi:hypothetical protein FRB91_011479 [Serendipita sp. 411]|nr:hypothetical protein FRC20_004358 [Serendipita sp. 405]KAG8847735.1 hypothetical protein FRB91_011479 [Serendipita sp. 411]
MSGTYVGAIDHESMESDTLDDAMIQIEEESVDDLILQPSLDGALSALMVEDIVDNHSEEEPILPYMRLLYLRSEHILKIARTLRIYSVSTVYIARQTLRLVLQLNKTIRADGLNDERRRERNILEEELISLEREIENYGNDLIVEKELLAQDEYDHWGKRMEVLYDIFFKTRSYFSNAQEPSKDEVFPKLLLYDRKTAALMNHPSFNLLDILDERYSAAAGSNGEEQSVGQLHTLLDGFQPPSDSETCTESQTVHAPEVIPLSNPFEDYGGRDLLLLKASR